MVIEFSYGLVLWAVPRFRRDVGAVPSVLPAKEPESQTRGALPDEQAPGKAEDGEAGRCPPARHQRRQ